MNGAAKSIHKERLAELDTREDRFTLIRAACQVFRRGHDKGAFTFKELKGACRLLSTLLGPCDTGAGDLCLLASHAETTSQFDAICRISRRHWDPIAL
ncbi:hypothetical protein AC480_03110 [miscellaneous Crenarchaeota group archaeon SMTZ1-55]|nr:MAG: hypothetical protein AC480_03110 [miscellaneous Crenarchaeota group archaeon SMTZ1-55]